MFLRIAITMRITITPRITHIRTVSATEVFPLSSSAELSGKAGVNSPGAPLHVSTSIE